MNTYKNIVIAITQKFVSEIILIMLKTVYFDMRFMKPKIVNTQFILGLIQTIVMTQTQCDTIVHLFMNQSTRPFRH